MCIFSVSLEAKRAAALDYLGKKWILHPEYSAAENPHHSLSHRTSQTLALHVAHMGELRAAKKLSSSHA